MSIVLSSRMNTDVDSTIGVTYTDFKKKTWVKSSLRFLQADGTISGMNCD
jgi:hypothetical protein